MSLKEIDPQTVAPAATPAVPSHRRGFFARLGRNRVFKRLIHNKVAMASLGFVIFLAIIAIFASWIAPQDPNAQNLTNRLQGVTWKHWLGTDKFGRDILSRLILACRVTMGAAMEGLIIASVIGIPVGLIAGYAGRWIDTLLSRIADGLLALPPLIYAMAIVGMLGRGLTNAMIAVGVVLSPRFFRLARAAAQSASKEAFAEAARADGASPARILWKHVLPNSAGPLLVQATFGVGLVITAEVSLSFLGLGVQLPTSSWGSLIRLAFDDVSSGAWPIIPPTVAIILTIAAFFLLGDGLRDAVGREDSGRS
jgi:peptide/nickel transport system permease protein